MWRGVTKYGLGLLFCGFMGLQAVPTGDPMPAAAAPRRVYVLHSGVHVILSKSGKNGAALRLRHELQRRGVAERDLVVLDNPFPAASWSDVLPRESVQMFLESADPNSPTAQSAYLRLDQALHAQGVTENDELLWIGHSAGGQMGMTMAHLGHRLQNYPDLARQARPHRFGLVATLGTPVVANHVPAEVPLRHYYSSADTVVRLLARHGSLLHSPQGESLHFSPCDQMGPNVKVRVFQGIRHHEWCGCERVLEGLLAETNSDARICWRQAQAERSCSFGLGQLLAGALDEECRISFEE
jgi:hypothetical protein